MKETTEVTLTYYIDEIKCEKCNGTGYQQDFSGIWQVCPICNGNGVIKPKKCEPYSSSQPWYPIPSPLHNFWYTDYDAQTKYIIC